MTSSSADSVLGGCSSMVGTPTPLPLLPHEATGRLGVHVGMAKVEPPTFRRMYACPQQNCPPPHRTLAYIGLSPIHHPGHHTPAYPPHSATTTWSVPSPPRPHRHASPSSMAERRSSSSLRLAASSASPNTPSTNVSKSESASSTRNRGPSVSTHPSPSFSRSR